jgi:transcription elongation factor GreA-like protein
MKNKLVKDVDDKLWKRFVAYCILNDVKVGTQLTKILEKFLKDKI